VSVRAGTPLRALQDELAPHGQHVSLDAARIADGATLGGLVATGDAGPAALVRGSLRDLVIGVTVVLADGTVARSGGHVIKNVAGYDLAKLLHGSHGTLAVLAEVVLRLHPLPQRTATLAVDAPLADAAELAAACWPGRSSPRRWSGRPTARCWCASRAPRPPWTPAWSACATRWAAPPGRTSRTAGRATRGCGTPSSPAGRRRTPCCGSGCGPRGCPALVGELAPVAATVGLGTGVATLSLPPDAVADAHAAVHAAGGVSQLRYRPPGADVPAWGPPPSAVGVLRAVKHELDPDGRFGPGRLSPWLEA
jgi:glycolate oxidase FAD binding subunit